MTNPQDPQSEDPGQSPYAPPDPNQPPPGPSQPPPPYAPPPAYGQPPPYGQQPPPGYGQPPPYGQPQAGAYRQGTNGFAIASIICAFLCSPLGLIFGFVAKSQISKSGQGGSGLATAGIIVSVLLIALNIALAASGHSLVHFNQNNGG